MAKENKKSLIIWALVALVIGVILGLVITNLSTTGQAKSITEVAPRTLIGTGYNFVLYQNMSFENPNGEYLLWTQENLQSNVPARIKKESSMSYNLDDFRPYFLNSSITNTERAENSNLGYAAYPETVLWFPNTTNTPTVSYSYFTEWTFGNGVTKTEGTGYSVNENYNSFIEASSLNVNCSNYELVHSTPTGINYLGYQFYIYDTTYNYDQVYYGSWIEARINPNGIQQGNLPQEAIDILQNNNGYEGVLIAHISTTENMYTVVYSANTYLNCQNGAITKLNSDGLQKLQQKTGTPIDVIKKLHEEGKMPFTVQK
ncbi:MAG: hypothetical protein WCX82_01420 [archaeon]|jgi:hypothetical protein